MVWLSATAQAVISRQFYTGVPHQLPSAPDDIFVPNNGSFTLPADGGGYKFVYWLIDNDRTSGNDVYYWRAVSPTSLAFTTAQNHEGPKLYPHGGITGYCPANPGAFIGYFRHANLFNPATQIHLDVSVTFLGTPGCGNTLPEPTLTTQVSAASVGAGISFYDVATLIGTGPPTGTIRFDLWRGTTIVFTSIVSVSGNGSYASAPYSTLIAGTYRWTAYYSGDAYNLSVATDINEPSEAIIVGPGTSVPTYRNVFTRLVMPTPLKYADVGTRVIVSNINPGISRHSQVDGSRVWYTRTRP